MMKLLTSILAALVVAGFTLDAAAQFVPVKVTVAKVQRRDQKKEGHADARYQPYRDGNSYDDGNWEPGKVTTKSIPSEFGCRVELANQTAKTLKSVEVKWTVVMEEGKDTYVAETGTKNFILEPAGKMEFETKYFKGKGAGYLVEVSVEGKLVVTSKDPNNVISMIEDRGGGRRK